MADDENIDLGLSDEDLRALHRLVKAGITDPRRLDTLVQLVDTAAAWGVAKRFLLQAAAATGALSVLAAALLWLKDWLNK